MKKKIVTIVIALMLSCIPAMAQIFISDEDFQNSRVSTHLGMDLPGTYNSGEDWYAPVGSGAVLLAGLAGAYLLGKRHKNEK